MSHKRSWRDKYTTTKSRHSPSNRYHNSNNNSNKIEPPYKKHKSFHNYNNNNNNTFIKPNADITYLERDSSSTNASGRGAGVMIFNKNHYKRMDIQRRTLPIYKYRLNILNSVYKYRTTIILAETGSGKTTQIAQYLYESGWTSHNRMICCTQPRRISTVTCATRVSSEMNDKVGGIVGYSIRFDSKISSSTRIKYLTDGMLLSELLYDPLLSQYSIIILDEAHERNINIDLLLGLIKKILKIRKDLRLIISSATMDAIKFEKFFTSATMDVNILCCEGRSYPVELFYLSSACNNYVSSAVNTVINIHLSNPLGSGDILVFLTGESEIINACKLCENQLLNLSQKYSRTLLILPMYSGLSFNKQLRVFKKTSSKEIRKVIFATNIAETSITIDGVVYVIDSGFVKIPSFDPLSGISSLFVSSISKACANQRKGRAGRISAGKCYRLYPESIYNSLSFNDYDIPEIQRSDLTHCILKLKSFGIDNILNFEFISPPPILSITYALELLYALNAIDNNCKLTHPFGYILSQLPCEPKMGTMLIESGKAGCSHEILSIASMLSIRNIWINKNNKKKNEILLKYQVLEGDHLTYLNIFNSFILNNRDGNWCKDNYFEYKSLKRATEIRQLLKKYLKHFKIPLISAKDNVSVILKCIIRGYFAHAAQIQSNGKYKTIRGNTILHIHPSSVLDCEGIPWIIYHQIIHMNNNNIYMHDITSIKPIWLKELAGHFYQIKDLTHNKERERKLNKK